jgi:predicted nucleotidyltransferase
MQIETLRQELRHKSVSRVVNKYILGNDPLCFGKDVDLILELKEPIANHFNIHVKSIEIVGSAKLGVSLSEERYGKAYDKDSDIDLVLVSSELFDMAWHDLLRLDFISHQLTEKDGEYLKECYDTIHRGFISPDRLPPASSFGKKWWKIFSDLSNKEKYEYRKIRGRLFKNWWFVEKYYSIRLVQISRALRRRKCR